jgi:hypothetical protein
MFEDCDSTDSLITLLSNLETYLNDLDAQLLNIQNKRKAAADALAVVKDIFLRDMKE